MLCVIVGGYPAAHPHPLLPAGGPQGPDDRAAETQAEDRSVGPYALTLFFCLNIFCGGLGWGWVF